MGRTQSYEIPHWRNPTGFGWDLGRRLLKVRFERDDIRKGHNYMAEMDQHGRHPGEITRWFRWIDCPDCDYSWPRLFDTKKKESAYIYLQCPNCLGGDVAADREATREQWDEWQINPLNKPLDPDEEAYLVAFITEITIPRGTELDLINVSVDRFPERDYPLDADIKTGDDFEMPEWVREYLDDCSS